MKFDKQKAQEAIALMEAQYKSGKAISSNYPEYSAARLLPASLYRVTELETALVEERARGNYYRGFHDRLREDLTWEYREPSSLKNEKRREASKQLQSEGLI